MLRLLVIVGALALCAGCTTGIDSNAIRDIRRVTVTPIANPDGFSWPYDLKMFQGGAAPGGALNPVSAFATGISQGIDTRIKTSAAATSADILKSTDTRLGDDVVLFMKEALQEARYEVVASGADARLNIELESVGYACDGLFMDGTCKPRINATFILEDSRSGKRLFRTSCNYGIQSSILPCSLDADATLQFARITDILSQPAKASSNLREAMRLLANHVVSQMKRPRE